MRCSLREAKSKLPVVLSLSAESQEQNLILPVPYVTRHSKSCQPGKLIKPWCSGFSLGLGQAGGAPALLTLAIQSLAPPEAKLMQHSL